VNGRLICGCELISWVINNSEELVAKKTMTKTEFIEIDKLIDRMPKAQVVVAL